MSRSVTCLYRHPSDPSMREHRDSHMAQNLWREITATIGTHETFVWFTSVTVLPDEDLRVKSI